MSNLPAGAINDPQAPWNANECQDQCKNCKEYQGNYQMILNEYGFCDTGCQEAYESNVTIALQDLFEAIDWSNDYNHNIVDMLCIQARAERLDDVAYQFEIDAKDLRNAHKENINSYKFN